MAPTGLSPWAVLGVDEHATLAEVRHAFRIKAKQTHPDRGGDRAEFERVRAAFEAVLHLAPVRIASAGKPKRPNPYAWCDEPLPRLRTVTPRRAAPQPPNRSATRFADILRAEMERVHLAA